MKFVRLFLLLPVLLVACSKSSKSPNAGPVPTANTKPGVGRIEIVGDSLAYGTGSTNNAGVTDCFRSNFAGTVENIAVPGTTSEEIEKTVDTAIAKNPKLIFISSGGNDAILNAMGQLDYPVNKTLAEMRSIFAKAVSSGALVVYLGLNPGLAGAERLPQISSVAASQGVIVVDGMNGSWTNTKLMSDEYHPNDAGYKIMCDRIIEAIGDNYP
jgi:lysophospholipase L1-like esterase